MFKYYRKYEEKNKRQAGNRESTQNIIKFKF